VAVGPYGSIGFLLRALPLQKKSSTSAHVGLGKMLLVLRLRGPICGGAPAFNFQPHGNSFWKTREYAFLECVD
jgi:hypothetical protein